MLALDKLFSNWFDDDDISFEELEAGTRDHLERLRQSNGQNRFTSLIEATEARYTAYFGQLNQAATARSTGKGTTLTLGDAIDALVEWITGDGREYIQYKIKDEAGRLRFFPRGASEYHQAKNAEWPGLLERLDKAFADLGGGFEADITAAYAKHRQNLLNALSSQSGQNKKKADARIGSQVERDLLTKQLSRNARTLGLEFEDQPVQAASFFDKKYFNQHQPTKPADAVPGKPAWL